MFLLFSHTTKDSCTNYGIKQSLYANFIKLDHGWRSHMHSFPMSYFPKVPEDDTGVITENRRYVSPHGPIRLITMLTGI